MIKKIFLKRGLLVDGHASRAGDDGHACFGGDSLAAGGQSRFLRQRAGYESLYVYNGTPYLAYEAEVDIGRSYDKAAVMEYTGGSWQMVGSPRLQR